MKICMRCGNILVRLYHIKEGKYIPTDMLFCPYCPADNDTTAIEPLIVNGKT